MLIISESELQVNRSGSFFGEFDFDIETNLYALFENENGLGIELKYRLYEGKNLFSENILAVQICENSSDSLCSINITRRNNL